MNFIGQHINNQNYFNTFSPKYIGEEFFDSVSNFFVDNIFAVVINGRKNVDHLEQIVNNLEENDINLGKIVNLPTIQGII